MLLEKELDKEAATAVIKGIKELLHQQYPLETELQEPESKINERWSIEARVFQKLQPKKKKQSDINQYFNENVIIIHDSATKKKNWLFS